MLKPDLLQREINSSRCDNILDANHKIDLDITTVRHVACPERKRQDITCQFCHARFNFLCKSEIPSKMPQMLKAVSARDKCVAESFTRTAYKTD